MRKIFRLGIAVCLVSVVIALPSVIEAQQKPRFKSLGATSSIDSSRIKQLRQEMKKTKDPARRREMSKEILKIRMARFKDLRGFGGKTGKNK